MIFGTRSELKRYRGCDPLLDRAIAFLSGTNVADLEMGRVEIDGNNVFANRFDYTTMPQEQAFYEAHLQYIDIHVLLEGQEQILVSHVDTMEETSRDTDADFVGYRGKEECRFPMSPEKFLLVYPGEAHMVKVLLTQECIVKKLVVKVLCREFDC